MLATCVPPHSSRFTPGPWWSLPSPPSCCCPNEAAPSAYVLHCELQQLNTVIYWKWIKKNKKFPTR